MFDPKLDVRLGLLWPKELIVKTAHKQHVEHANLHEQLQLLKLRVKFA